MFIENYISEQASAHRNATECNVYKKLPFLEHHKCRRRFKAIKNRAKKNKTEIRSIQTP